MKLPYILQDVDRHGTARTYVRRRGVRIRLREEPGSAEFLAEYQEAMREIGAPIPRRERNKAVAATKAAPGTLRWLADQYEASGEFRHLDTSTQKARRGLLRLICESTLAGKKRGNLPYRLMEAKHIRKLRDEHADTPEAANGRVKALRQMFAWAVEAEHATGNPAADVPYFGNDGQGFHTWTVEEVERFKRRHAPGTKARRALALLLLTGVRRSDVVRLGPQNARDGWLRFTEQKGRKRNPKIREIPILPELAEEIAAATGHLAYLVTQYGRPFTANGFGNWFRRRCNEAGLPHCSAHGLRKAGATIAAENGATAHQLMAIFGWASIKQANHYTLTADRKRLVGAAMHLLKAREG